MRRVFALALALSGLTLVRPAHGQLANQHSFPFQTIQSDGSVVVLSYYGDELFDWYEDAAGYTVVRVRADYFYAHLDKAGRLAPTPHRVGSVDPARVGLSPGILPDASVMNAARTARMAEIAAEPPVLQGIPAGARLIEGCILVPDVPDVPAPFGDDGGQSPQNGTHITTNLWPDGLVPYSFDASVSEANRTRMRDAMDSWEAVAGVRFVERTTETHYVRMISGTGNWSYVGRIGGAQDLSIYNWTYHFIIMHELAHALGVWHEQSRPDRDAYVQINTANIQTGMEHNFDIQADAGTNGSYDFDSIMHYSQCSFANCTCSLSCTTITCLPPNESWQNQIGQRSHLSTGDAATMAALYGPPLSDDAAQMTAPAEDGDKIENSSFDFAWSAGTGVTQYRLRIGLVPGGTDIYNQTTAATSATVSGLPTNGTMIYVELASQIAGDWHTRSYAYLGGPDLCPGFDDNLDADDDGVPDGCDVCAGFDDNDDADSDNLPDGCDDCPDGEDSLDSDDDGTNDCLDACPDDAGKVQPGECGCGQADVDSDGDGHMDCDDECPDDPLKTLPGQCGCGEPDLDSDGDGASDCNDLCPLEPAQTTPGLCGCGSFPTDANGDGVAECSEVSGATSGGSGSGSGGALEPLTELTFVCGAGGGGASLTSLTALAGMTLFARRRRRRR